MTVEMRRRWGLLLGFVAALVVLVVLFWFLGVDDMLETLGRAHSERLVFVALAAAGWLLAWALALRAVLTVLDVHLSPLEAVLVFTATVFANNVTPFGQAGGEPLGALLVTTVADSKYETGFAAIVSLDALRLTSGVAFGVLGVAYYATTVTFSARHRTVAVVVIAVALCLPVVGVALWRNRPRVADRAVRGLTTSLGTISKITLRRRAPAVAAIERRVEGFVGSLERVADEPRVVAVALSLTALGWLGLIGCLWLSFVALGETDLTLLAASFVAIPLGSVAAATPFPGGLGGMEAALVAVLTPLTSVPVATIGAAVVCYRIATYWLPTLVGGAVTGAFGSTAWW